MTASSPAKLLIVDDEAAQMKALCRTLEDNGYAPTGFTSAKAALTALREQKFELLLTDLKMPEMDGIALLRAALETDPDLVGIMMTGHGTIDTAVEAMKTGALDYILKPFKLSAILPVLARALTVRRLRLQNAELERRVRERTAELEAANRELEAFSYSISHDLRAPLRAIGGFARILDDDHALQLSAGALQKLQRIHENAEKMSLLIDGLLAFSRLTRAPLRKQAVAPDKIVRRVLEDLQAEQTGRNLQITVAPMPPCEADPLLLQQVFMNLLSNALKYTRHLDPARIKVGCQDNQRPRVYYVKDNGAGFDMQYADKLFGVFQRLHRTDEFEGTGVGLAIVQRIIHRHGGRIWAEAAPNKGAAFYFTLEGGQADA